MRVTYDSETDTLTIVLSEARVAESDEDKNEILQYRPYILRMFAIAKAMISLHQQLKAAAKDIMESAIEEIESMLTDSGQVESLTGDILRRKALDRVADAAVAVDADGNIVDLTPVVVGHDDDEEEPAGDDGQDDESSPEIEE